jgi:undecaprenyl-diphosphatase
MNFLLVIFLGILQGITEFFPISSSGHLVLAEKLFNLPVAELKAFDVVLHAGTLVALLIIFWREWQGIIIDSYKFLTCKIKPKNSTNLKLLAQLFVATLPICIVGFFWHTKIDLFSRGENSTFFIAICLAITAILLLLAEKFSQKKVGEISWKNVFWLGIFQASALLPGISRSGSTIAAGMFSGLTRATAAKFSFLMLAPATFGATILTFTQVFSGKLNLPPLRFVLVGFIVSIISSTIAAKFLLKFVQKNSLNIFVIYLFILVGILFIL